MYLSRLVLDPRNRAVRQDLGDCQAMHRTVLSAFPQTGDDQRARAEFGVLFRVDEEARGGQVAVLVQSAVEPDWSRLPPGYLDGVEHPLQTKRVAEQYAGLRNGTRLRFRLRANPTKRVAARSSDPRDARMKGKRVDLRREEDQIAWLRRKGETSGFVLAAVRAATAVPDVRTAPQGRTLGWRRRTGSGRPDLTFGAVVFDGELVVTDAAAFQQTLERGIGSGKAYGFGLLSVALAGG